MQAVITGDLIDSTKYTPHELDTILNVLGQKFAFYKEEYVIDFKIFRGDSFQGVILNLDIVLDIVIDIKTSINKIKNTKVSRLTDVRIAIGIGDVNLKRESILESNGEAFQFSGRLLDSMKGDYPRLLIKTPDSNFNDEFNVHFSLFDSVTSKWSLASAEVIHYLHSGFKEKEIADELGINQSAVNHRKKAANWDSIALLLKRYKTAIKKYTDDEQ